ncbi:MAG: hypothetical protein P8M18_12885 [Woeseiaceae bacterium]|nr:hypothetical protein [Woeseiaceae bacterium]
MGPVDDGLHRLRIFFPDRTPRFFQVTRFGYILRNTFEGMLSRPGDADSERMILFQATMTSLVGVFIAFM